MGWSRDDYVVATYLVEDKEEKLKKRAESIAIGLTVGSWTDLPATKQEAVKAHCGQVDAIETVEQLQDGRVKAAISIAYPMINFTANVPALLTTVFGKLSMDGRIKLVGLRLPPAFVRQFPGPKYGIDGIRQRTNVYDRPFVMSIFKSCIGNDLQELSSYYRDQAMGGVDFIKDDEIFFTEMYATPEERVQAFERVADEVEHEIGKRVRYAVNLTGPSRHVIERARRLSDLGAGALLFNVFAYGLDLMQELAADKDVHAPIMAHPAVSGALYGSPDYGISSSIVLGLLPRITGADIVLYPSAYGSVTLSQEEGLQLVDFLTDDNGLKPSLPAPSAGIHPGLVPLLVRDLGNDFIVNAGGGIHGHPSGATAGGRAFVAAVDATVAGRRLRDAAEDSPELKAALDVWGCPTE